MAHRNPEVVAELVAEAERIRRDVAPAGTLAKAQEASKLLGGRIVQVDRIASTPVGVAPSEK